MKKYEVPHAQARLDHLLGLSVKDVGYAADMLTMGFGPEGGFRLHIQCSYRMATEEMILFDRIDYFEPSDALCAKWHAEGLEWQDFPQDWPDKERRLFEQVKLLNQRLDGMTVTEVRINQLGDLTIRFANGLTLLALPMRSDGHESWRFWNDEMWPDQHMVVCGDGVELHGPGAEESRFSE